MGIEWAWFILATTFAMLVVFAAFHAAFSR